MLAPLTSGNYMIFFLQPPLRVQSTVSLLDLHDSGLP